MQEKELFKGKNNNQQRKKNNYISTMNYNPQNYE